MIQELENESEESSADSFVMSYEGDEEGTKAYYGSMY